MAHSGSEEVKRHLKVYVAVFAALAALTVITVAVSYLDLSMTHAIIVALCIAAVKASLVALYFMHLVSEKSVIFWILLLTVIFFFTLLLIPVFAV